MGAINFIASAMVIRSARDDKRAAARAADLYNKGRESIRAERDEAIDVIRELLGHRMVMVSDEEHLSAVNSRERARAYLRTVDARKP
jgi:hypothetical protein